MSERKYGLVDRLTQTLWVYENKKMVERSVTYVPCLYWMFNDILMNVAFKTLGILEVSIKKDSQSITICSITSNPNFKKISVDVKEFVPFCKFTISRVDGKKLHTTVYSNNTSTETECINCNKNEKWTEIILEPQFSTYGMERLDDDTIALMKKRAIDMAGCLGKSVTVKLDGQTVRAKSFFEYVNFYTQPGTSNFRAYQPLPSMKCKVNDSLEICVTVSDGQFQQVSFVNLINTIKGGDHVEVVAWEIVNHLVKTINEKHKKANLTNDDVKNHLWIFVNANLAEPKFDPKKESLVERRTRSFTTPLKPPEEFLKKVASSQIVDFLKTRTGIYKEKLQIKNFEDAYLAGGKHSADCTLILVEGDSATALPMAGLDVLGRSYYGYLPLRGKLLNVREASKAKYTPNEEINNIIKILGLQWNKSYEGDNYAKSLRYGKVMIMADQDYDGSHIKGLLINLFHKFWPALLKAKGFLSQFITPIIKATNKGNPDQFEQFFSIGEFEDWWKTLDNCSEWSITYYKGLGRFSREEGKVYFQNLDKHLRYFVWDDDAEKKIELAFSKKKIDERKEWIQRYMDSQPDSLVDYYHHKEIKYSDFFEKEYIEFCTASLQRSIPSMVDGLKRTQRKILFCAFKKNLIKSEGFSQFSGYVAKHSAYHHGADNIANVIVGMAQNFVGSNNINLFIPDGDHGTREQGGKRHAAARYISTRLSPIARFIFTEDDDESLVYLNEEGKKVEPKSYLPIIPMVLVNGGEGIGVGSSTYVPNYHPIDIIKNIRHLIESKGDVKTFPVKMCPWYKGFNGRIERSQSGDDYTSYGCIDIEEESNGTIKITELPIRMWIKDYLIFLDSVTVRNANAKNPFIEDYQQCGELSTVDICVNLSDEQLTKAKNKDLVKKFKLETKIKTSNMVLFDEKGRLKRYDTPEEVLQEFYNVRLQKYEMRLKNLRVKLRTKAKILESKREFVERYIGGKIRLPETMQDKAELVEHFKTELGCKMAEDVASLKLESLTKKTLEALEEDCKKSTEEIDEVENKTAVILWLEDLRVLEKELLKDKLFHDVAAGTSKQ